MERKYDFLLPAYKRDYLTDAIESILNQSYDKFKLIILNDDSPYDLESIVQRFEKDPRVSCYHNERNIGGKSLVKCWNKLLSFAKSEFIILASDDDIYESNFLEEINTIIEKHPKAGLIRGKARSIDANGNTILEDVANEEFRSSHQFVKDLFSENYVSCISNYVYRTSLLKEIGGFVDFPKAWFSDDATNVKMSRNGCCSTEKIVFNFRMSGKNISSQWGDPEDCAEKMRATYMFYKWMGKWVQQQLWENSELKKAIVAEFKHKVHSNVINNIFACHFFDFMRFLIQCPKDVGYLKPRMLAHWLKSRVY